MTYNVPLFFTRWNIIPKNGNITPKSPILHRQNHVTNVLRCVGECYTRRITASKRLSAALKTGDAAMRHDIFGHF